MLGIATVAAGCSLGGSSHGTLTLKQALDRARADGFVRVASSSGPAWHCAAHALHLETQPGDATPGTRPGYTLAFGDRRAPPTADGTARAGMSIVLFPSAGFAARCAAAGLYSSQHQMVVNNGKQTVYRWRRISADTIVVNEHPLGIKGTVPGTTGEYDTWLASGRVLAFGIAYNLPNSRIVQADLARLAGEISG